MKFGKITNTLIVPYGEECSNWQYVNCHAEVIEEDVILKELKDLKILQQAQNN